MDYSVQMYVRNIRAVYSKASTTDLHEGLTWYDYAKAYARELSEQYGLPLTQIAGIIAAYSINAQWQGTVANVPRFLDGNFEGLQNSYTKSCDILKYGTTPEIICDILKGPKITMFFLNIIGNPDAITIDRHAAKLAGMTDSLTPKRMRELQAAYKIAADTSGITPAQMQAVTWCAWRRLTNATQTYGPNVV